MIVIKIIYVLLFVIFIIMITSVIHPYNPPIINRVVINPVKDVRSSCLVNKQSCLSDGDCKSCTEDNLICKELAYTDKESKSVGNKGGKYCLPSEKPNIICNKDNGGIKIWSGYSGSDTMNWDCLCSHPDYFSEHGCNQINPHICMGGTYEYTDSNLPPDIKPIGSGICNCDKDSVPYVRNGDDTPFCVNKNLLPKDKDQNKFFGYYPYDHPTI